MKHITEYLSGNQKEYKVSFLNCVNDEEIPVSATIYVDENNADCFEKFLNEQEGDIFIHAEGGNVEY